MSRVVIATFDGGVFRPDQPPDLPPRTRFRLIVEDLPAATATTAGPGAVAAEDAERSGAKWEEFEALCEEFPIHSGGKRPTRDELYDRG